MDVLGPFEPEPHLAIAVSGGADSLALAALTAGWLHARGGRSTTLTVDHGLRPAATAEAAWVAAMMRRFGLEHEVIHWRRPSFAHVSQQAAREARYALMDEACARIGSLHLLVGHHADDQAATVAMRRRRGPGPGLAGMPAVRELAYCRLLRPLLAFPRARLEATARTLGLGWIDDPSNRDPRYERTSVVRLAHQAEGGVERGATEHADARWLAKHARVEPGSALSLDGSAWRMLDEAAAARVLAATAAAAGRVARRPSATRAFACAQLLAGDRRRATLARTLIGWQRDRLVFRPERPGEGLLQALAGAPFAAPHVASDVRSLMC